MVDVTEVTVPVELDISTKTAAEQARAIGDAYHDLADRLEDADE